MIFFEMKVGKVYIHSMLLNFHSTLKGLRERSKKKGDLHRLSFLNTLGGSVVRGIFHEKPFLSQSFVDIVQLSL
jgi:hypothetical protein